MKHTPEELTTMLAGALNTLPLELHEALGLMAENSREHTQGAESRRVAMLTNLLIGLGNRADKALRAERQEEIRLANVARYEQQVRLAQAARAELAPVGMGGPL